MLVSKISIEIYDVPSDMDRLLFLTSAGTKIEVSINQNSRYSFMVSI
jgi:hypothetical protein